MSTETPIERTGEASPETALAVEAGPRRGAWRYVVALGVVGALLWAAVSFYNNVLTFGGAQAERGALTYSVSRNPLVLTVNSEGNVESASNLEVKCRVAGGSTILWIVEDGKIVEEGEEIIRLDTATIDDKLNSQIIVYEKAVATEIQAQEDLEATKISVREYEEGTFIELQKMAEAGIQIALENMRSSESQLEYSNRMVRKGFVSSLQRDADAFAVERAKLDLDAANTKKKVLVEFTKPKTLRDLIAKREAAAAKLRSEQAGLQLEKARLDRLREQLKNCIITAPKKGMVVYANDSRGRFGGSERSSPIEEGAIVRETQALVRLPDLARMQVKVTVHESRVDQIKPGLPARIVIQDQEYKGKVLNVANQPSSGSWMSANVKEYATVVSIEGESSGLRPGMTAKVTILIDDVKDALTLPVSSVVEQRGSFYAWVQTPAAPERRVLQLGRSNDKLIEVIDGVKEAEVVYRNPRAMVREAREDIPFEKHGEDPKFAPGDLANGAAPGDAKEGAAGKDGGMKGAPVPSAGPAAADTPLEGIQRGPPTGPVTAMPGEEGRRGENGPPGEGGEGSKDGGRRRGGGRNFDPMQFDKDGDKKLSRAELPEQMAERMMEADTNADGFIDATELAEMRSRFRGGMNREGGEGGGPGGPGGEGRGKRDAEGGRPPEGGDSGR